jgi:hypothetical protein
MHFDNLLFILLVLVAILFRWLASAATKASKNSDERERRSTSSPPPPPIRRAPAESDAERIRKFLEALGQPQDTPPPPPVARRIDVPPRPLAPVQAPREMVAGPLPKRRVAAPKKIQLPGQIITPTYEPKKFSPQSAAAIFEVQESAAVPEPAPPPVRTPAEAYAAATRPAVAKADQKIDIAVLLASSSGLRDAIVLREIFGPPRSLQPLELVGSA